MATEIPERISPMTSLWLAGAGEHLGRYRFAQRFVAGHRVIDIGCGNGYGSHLLKQAGAASVIGLDSDPAAIAAASAFRGDGVSFACDDAHSLATLGPAPTFDIAVAFEVIEHLQSPEQLLLRIVQVLVDDGLAIISTPDTRYTRKDPDGRPLNRYHLSEMEESEFAGTLARYFSSITMLYQVLTPEGLRARRTRALLNHMAASKTFSLECRLRRWLGKAPLDADLEISCESDYEIVDRRFWNAPATTMVAVARGPRHDGTGGVRAPSPHVHGIE